MLIFNSAALGTPVYQTYRISTQARAIHG